MSALHFRKMFGGGMRQVGILAAAAMHGLDNHVERLAEDHANAGRLAYALAELPRIKINPDEVQTNILFFDVDPSLGTAGQVCRKLADQGVLLLPEDSRRVRAVTHLDVSSAQIDQAIKIMAAMFRQP